MRYQKNKLPNGLTVLSAKRSETKAVTLLFLFRVGSRYEPAGLNGISHFMEHMLFKGTDRRPSTLHISQELDSLGGEYNAMTSKDYTGYYIKVDSVKTDKAFDILADMVFHSRLEKQTIDQEKGVIIEEINMYEDNPLMYVQDLFEASIYKKTSGLGQLISGPKKNIRTINRQKLQAFQKKYYHPQNMVVVGSGNISNQQLLALCRKHFADLPKKKESKYQPVKIDQTRPRVKVMKKQTEQFQIGLGCPAYSYWHKDVYVLEVLNNILGGMMSSRLFIEIRVKRSLAYFINSSLSVYQDTGNLMIQAGLEKKSVKSAVSAILNELDRMKKEIVPNRELKKAKDNIKGKVILKIEDSENIASLIGKQYLLTKRIITPNHYLKKIKAVTSQDIKRVANDIFKTSRLNLVVIGPAADSKSLNQLLKLS